MKRLIHYIDLYFTYMKNCVWRFASYPLDTFLTAVGLFVRELSTFAGILAIASVTKGIGGFTVYELCMVFAFTAMSEAMSSLFLSSIWDIWGYVHKGKMDVLLTRPAPVFFQMNAQSIHYPAILSFLIPLGILLCSIRKSDITVDFLTVLFLLECIVCGMLMNSFIYLVANGLNFWIVRGNVADALESFREFARYPMHIFPAAIQITLSVVIPFGFIGYYPTMYLADKTTLCVPLLVLVVTVVTGLAGGLVWKKGLQGYNSTGT